MDKVCRLCGAPSAVAEFDPGRAVCKDCRRAQVRDNYAKNREVYIARSKVYYANNKVAVNERNRAYALAHSEKVLKARLRHHYKITVAEYQALWDKQGGVCAICASPIEHIDHDHDSGIVRGLLCALCNVGLGAFRDNPTLLLKASNYLEHPTWQEIKEWL